MTATPRTLTLSLLEAQSEFQTVISTARENSTASKAAKMTFLTAEFCIAMLEHPERLLKDEGRHLLSALRAMAQTFNWLKKISLEFTATNAAKISAGCARCESEIFALLGDIDPETAWGHK